MADENKPTALVPRTVREVSDPVAVFDTSRFEHMQRVATLMANTPLVPAHLKGANPQEALGNCFLVVNQAQRWNADPFAVAQATYVVHGKLGYEGKLVAAILDSQFGIRLKHKYEGKEGSPDRKITLWDPEDPDRSISGTVGQWRTKNENWLTQPDDQLYYRGTRQWCRRYKPAAMMGIYTPDELASGEGADAIDITPKAPLPPPLKGPAVAVTWRAGDALEYVPVREFSARALEFIRREEPAAVLDWAERNRLALREFWGISKDEALAIKAEIEKAAARREAPPVDEPPAPEPRAPSESSEQMSMLPDAEPDDRETIVRDILSALKAERDSKKRAAIWESNQNAFDALTEEQVARLRAAYDQMEMQAGKPRGKAAA